MKADYWLPIKPGTDTALLLAWMNVLIAENLYDAEFIQKWTVGFDQLAEHVKPFTPEWAAPITDLPVETNPRVGARDGAQPPAVGHRAGSPRHLVRQRHAADARRLHRQRAAGRVRAARRIVFQQVALH